MEVFHNWLEEICIVLVSFLVCGHDSDGALGSIDTALDAHLDVATFWRVLLFELGPELSRHVALEERIALWEVFKGGVGDYWNSLRNWAIDFDSVVFQLLLCHKISKVLDLE